MMCGIVLHVFSEAKKTKKRYYRYMFLILTYTIRFICIFAPKLRIYSIYWANLLNLLSEITQSD